MYRRRSVHIARQPRDGDRRFALKGEPSFADASIRISGRQPMLGDAQTVSDQDNEQESRSFDALQGWTTLSSSAELDLPVVPSWDDGWAAPTPATVESNAWDAREPLGAGDATPSTGGFAGWGGLSSTDSSAVSQDLTAWDSPSDAVVAEAPETPWGLDEASEAPVWAAAPTAPLPSVTSSWSGPELEQPVMSTWPTRVIAAVSGQPATDHEVSTDAEPPARKRRGRLADLSAQRNASTTDVSSDPVAHHGPSAHTAVSDADGTALLDPVRTDQVAPLEVFAPLEVPQAAVEMHAAETHVAVEMHAAEVFEAPALEAQTDAATTAVTSRGFFAKRDPLEAASSPRETPKTLRIGAVVSLLVGLGLFGYNVINSRSSDTKPTVATKTPSPVAPSADASTTVAAPPTAPTGEAELVPEQAVDPIFESGPATPSPSIPGGATSADPIFGSDQGVSLLPPSAGLTAASDPLFGPSPTVPAPDGGATAKQELTFDQPGTAGR